MGKLHVIPARTAANLPEPPGKLGKTGLSLWNRVQAEYAITDVGGLELLAQCCAAADRAEALSAQIDRDGAVVRTKNGLKEHPGLRGELAARSFVCRTLTRLGVTTEPLKQIGRPCGGFGWSGDDDAN
jgi:hypothetical protein